MRRRTTILAVALLAILVLFVGGLVIYSAGGLSGSSASRPALSGVRSGSPRTSSWSLTRRPPRPSA
jgi:hypothetical protein